MALIDIIEQDLSSSGEEINYHLSGGEAVQRGVGRVMVRSGDYILIESVSTPNTVIRFPTQNLNLIVKADDDPNALWADFTDLDQISFNCQELHSQSTDKSHQPRFATAEYPAA